MDDTNASLTNRGSGFTAPNWGQSTPPPLPGGEAPPKGTPETGKATTSTTAGTVTQEEVKQKDTLLPADTTDSIFTFTTPTSTIPSSPYTAYSSNPNLKPSTVNDPQLGQQGLDLLQNPPPEKLEGMFDRWETSKSYATTSGTLLDGNVEETSTLTSNDPQVIEYAQKNGISVGAAVQRLQLAQNDTFDRLVAQKYPEDVANKLIFAHYLPEASKNLSPDLRAQLSSLEKQVRENVANSMGFSDDWTGVPVDAKDFTENLTNVAGFAFDKAIEERVAEGSLSASDARTLKAMQAGLATGTPTLKNLLIQIQAQVTAAMQAKYGFDVSYQPPSETLFYNNVINGDFAQTFQKKVGSWMPGNLTDSQRELLAKYAKNPNDPSIPTEIKQLAQQIENQRKLLLNAFPNMSSLPEELKGEGEQLIGAAKTDIIGKYGLDATWQTNLTSLYPPGVDPKLIANAQSGLDIANEIYQNALVIGNKMPDGPEKEQFLNYLKIIGQALQNLQDTIYALQAANSDVAKRSSRAKLDMQMNDIDKQQRAADKAAAQAAKMRSMGPMGKAFEWIMKIILLIICSWMGPFAALLAVAIFVDSIVGAARGGKTGLDLLMDKITESMPAGAAAAVKFFVLAVIAILTQNVYLVLYFLCDQMKVIQDSVKAFGGDKMAQEITAMIVQMACEIALMIAMMVASFGGAGPGIVARLASSVARSLKIAKDALQKFLVVTQMVFAVIMASLQITGSSIKLNNSLILANIDLIKGEAEKYSEEIQAIIAILKKLIKKLLDMLQGSSQDIATISTQQGKKWMDVNQITTDLAS